MSYSRYNFLPMGLFKDADEPVICGDYAVLIQKLYNGSKITVYNVVTGSMRSVPIKGVSCFNAHADDKMVVFEYMGKRRGIGVISTDNWELEEINNIYPDIVLGGVWKDSIIYRHGHDILKYDIKDKKEEILVPCHHISGPPVVGNGCCAWLQRYRDKTCVAIYNIENGSRLFLSSPVYINEIHITGDHLIYQSSINDKCSIFVYDIKSGNLGEIFKSNEWIDLYSSKDDIVIWTARREYKCEYVFDIWVLNLNQKKPFKILSGCKNSVIPEAAGQFVMILNNNFDGDSLMLLPVGK